MRFKKSVKMTAWLLAAVIFAADITGNQQLAMAAPLTEEVEDKENHQYPMAEQEPEANAQTTQEQETGNPISTENYNTKDTQTKDSDADLQESEKETKESTEGETLEETKESEAEKTTEEAKESEVEKTLEESYEKQFATMLQEYEMFGVLAANSQVWDSPSEDAGKLHSLPSGYQVRFLDVKLWNQEIWFQISYGVNDVEYTGFIREQDVVTGDARLTQWKEAYAKAQKGRAAADATARNTTDLSAFPASYRTFIKSLIQLHPNWMFVPMNTGLNWSEVVENEMADARNLVDINAPITWKSTAAKDYDVSTGKWIIKNGTTWVQASEPIVKYYLDPRNFLNESSVFQFEQLTYNAECHTESGVEKILNGTFMGKKKLEDGSGGGITYAQAFMKIGEKLKVSPYFLASRIRQEQGVYGTSKLISGTYPNFEGYYNYFNISATGIGEQVIISGLTEAKEAGWTTRYKALYGGAKKTAENYISKGQDTFYLQKFDVDASYNGLYWHQYMQNLLAADNESKNIRNSYTAMGAIDNSFVFKVPVYENMPDSLCPLPGDSLSKPTLKVSKNGYISAKLTWNEVTGAAGYQVYRKEGDGSFQKIKTLKSISKTSYTDKTVVPGKVYTYKVRAYLKANAGNYYSKCSATKQVDYRIPETSWDKVSVKDYTTIKVFWKKADVDGYKIYRKTDSGKFTKIKTIKNNATVGYKDAAVLPGHTYSYRIRGYKKVDGKNYYSEYTAVKSAEIKMEVPKLNSVSVSGTTQAKLSWKADSKATGYYVYRSSTEKGGYKKVKAITSNKTLEWLDTGISPGGTYYYKVRSYVKTVEGKKKSSASKALMAETKLVKPTVKNITSTAKGLKLKWKKSSTASGYKIYRSTTAKGGYKLVKKVTGDSTVTFTDKKVTRGNTYYYKVRAFKKVNGKNRYSSYSKGWCLRTK